MADTKIINKGRTLAPKGDGQWLTKLGFRAPDHELDGAKPALTDAIRIEEISDIASLRVHSDAWRKLVRTAASANPSLEDYVLGTVCDHKIDLLEHVRFILIWSKQPGYGHSDLIGFFPVKRQAYRWGVPVRFGHSWQHYFSFLGSPLIDKEQAADAVAGFCAWLEQNFDIFLFQAVREADPVFDHLIGHLTKCGHRYRFFDRHHRAMLQSEMTGADYLAHSISAKKRKEYRRLRTRLAELGQVRFVPEDLPAEISDWIEDFLALEARGWKGRSGQAFLSRDARAQYVRDMFKQAALSGKGLFWKLTLDEKPIAMAFGLRSAAQAWYCKIAYDEDYARFSPGVLLSLEVTREVADRADITRIDSCAKADHPMIDHIWRERLAVTDLLVATGRSGRLWSFELIFLLEHSRRNARDFLKTLLRIFSKRKNS